MHNSLEVTHPKKPLISVLTVVLNGEATIRDCIESVLAQTYPEIEHVIVDGASTDMTVDILKEYGDRISTWISEPDSGIYNALNKALLLAKGTYYIPLGSDDVLFPAAAEQLIAYIEHHKIAMGRVQCTGPSGRRMNIYNHSAGTLVKTDLHDALGLYDESYKIAADTKFLEQAKHANLINYIGQDVGKFVLGGASSNYAKTIMEHSRAMRESGSWGYVRSASWLLPRLLYAKLK